MRIVRLMIGIVLLLTLAQTAMGQKKNPKNEQIAIDEQLANQHFRSQEYEQARDLYGHLYERTKQNYHFQQYVECLLI